MKERGYDKLFSDITIEELSHKIVRLAKQRDAWQEKAMNMIEKSTHKEQAEFYDDVVEKNDRIYKKKIRELELENQRLVQQLEHDETVVPREAYQAMKERYGHEVDNAEYWKAQYRIANDLLQPNKGCGYAFSEIPNDTDGQEFVDTMKKYLNKDSYKMRVRGQHIKPELRGTGATYWGQSKAESTHMRIYIDKKKGE
mgnify:CR=1 FL=1